MLNRSYVHPKQHSSGARPKYGMRPAAFFVAVTIILLCCVDYHLRPNIAQALRYKGKIVAIQSLSSETLKVLEPMNLSYEDIVHIARDSSGNITSIQADMGKLNTIKNQLEQNVTTSFNDRGICNFSVPLGSLLGSVYLSGRGPAVPLKVAPAGLLHADFVSRFESAGINQTVHRIYLYLTMEVTTFAPLHKADSTISTSMVLAETVIVGKVPEYYTSIEEKSLPNSFSALFDPLKIKGGKTASGLTE